MRPRRWPAAALALAAALACATGTADASPPPPADLRVNGGADAWRSDTRFSLNWTIPAPSGPALRATLYRVRDPHGNVIDGGRLAWAAEGIWPLTVPAVPGAYSAEVWFEDAAGEQGQAAVAQLRFDDARPASIEPQPISGWIGRTAFPLRVRLGHPAGPLPLSGIRGYAIAIDGAPAGAPCAAPDRCSDAETTLRGGIEDDEVTIVALPEGTPFLHAVAVSGSGMKSATSGRAVLRVDTTDPLTQLSGVPPGWTNRPVRLTASATDAGSGMAPDGEGPPPATAIRVDGGAPAITLGEAVTVSVIEEGVHRIAYYARDAAGNVNDGGESNGIANHAPRTTWARIDRTPPAAAFTNSQDPRDPDLLRLRIADALSGPDLARGWIGVRLAGSGDRFEPLPPAPPGERELRARWDSDACPPGEYEFRAIGYDAAGNAVVATRRSNGGRMALSNPLKATTTLRAAFSGRAVERTVPLGHSIRLSGRLTTGRRTPMGAMPVRIVERFAPGANPATRVSTVRTGPDGTYSIRLGPGPSREVTAAFDGNRTLARSVSRPLALGVRSAVRLRVSSRVARVGGAPIVFHGALGAARGAEPTAGRSVQLQFRLPGLPWAEFRTIQTYRSGRFRYAYRFSDDDSRGARFQFRAYAPAQENWPYEPAGSRPVIVRGR
jgi:hypothetical protein